MFLSLFIYFCLSLVFADTLPQTTITPNGADLVAGSWTISVALPSPTTLEVLIETLFNQYVSTTLIGPTTFTSLVRDRPANGAGSVSTGNAAASKMSSGRSRAANSSSTLAAPPPVGTQNQAPYGMDPDSELANEYDKAYANTTYTPPAYVPIKIAPDVCALWDPNCKGNKTLAAEQFFTQGKDNSSGTMLDLLVDPCFNGEGTDASGTKCNSSLLNPASASFSSAVKSYMREPQCSKDYESIQPVSSRLWEDCCGTCYIYGPNVDVYYWPDSSAETSCLSIIGSDVVPLNVGAQTDAAGVVYWAASTNLYDIYVPTVTTALITTINGVVVKEAIANPWGTSPSITTTRPVSEIKKRNPLSVHPRAFNPLYSRELGTESNSSSGTGVPATARAGEITGSVAVSDGFTFTSPSVYVAFYSLSATDMCGFRGNNISSTMVAFAPGELSTVQGHLWGGGVQNQKTKVFDFADLPCPPFDVMYDDWYKPAPGEPYRPLIALPEKVRDLDPWWNACTDAFYFTGLDPPRALQKAAAMITPASPAANHDPTITPDPAQPVPSLPVKTDTSQPGKAADDPSQNKNLDPPQPATPSSNGDAKDPSPIDGVPPTQTVNGVDPPQEASSKAPVEPPIDPGTSNDPQRPATPQQNGGDPQQGTNPKANDPGSDSPAANPPASSTADQQSGHKQQGTDPNKDQQNNALAPAPTSDPAPANNPNPHPQPGSENTNPAPQPPTNPTPPAQPSISNPITNPTSPPTLHIPSIPPLTPAPANPAAYLIANTILSPNSPAITIAGTRYSLAPSALVIGTRTVPLATPGSIADQIARPGALWAGSVPFTPLPGPTAIIGGSTLSISGPALTTTDGIVLSVAAAGLVVGDSTYAYPTPPASASATPLTTALVVAGQHLTANPSGGFSVNGTTIGAGGPGVVLDGTPVSVDRSGHLAVGTGGVGLDSAGGGGAAGTSVVVFEGRAGRGGVSSGWMVVVGWLLLWVVCIWY